MYIVQTSFLRAFGEELVCGVIVGHAFSIIVRVRDFPDHSEAVAYVMTAGEFYVQEVLLAHKK